MTEVLVRHHATFYAMVESNTAAVGHVENLTFLLLRVYTHVIRQNLLNVVCIEFIYDIILSFVRSA